MARKIILLKGNKGLTHELRQLTPTSDNKTLTEQNTYLFKSKFDYTVGCKHGTHYFISPASGPIIQIGEVCPVEDENIDAVKILDIVHTDLGHIITIEEVKK